MPQGSILGPILFLIYINDIVKEINSNIRLFAADTSMYVIVDNPVLAASELNRDLSKIEAWAKTWLVTFNPNKIKLLIISRKIPKSNHPNLLMNNI